MPNPPRMAWLPDLIEKGWAVSDDVFPQSFWSNLLGLREDTRAHTLRAAGTGHGASFQAQSVRGDSIQWLRSTDHAEQRVLRELSRLRQQLRQELWLPLNDQEAHLAFYPPGSGYARHLDSFHRDNARMVSLVSYLNPAWEPAHGGCLRMHLPGGVQDVEPRLGRTVIFLSEKIEHEVLPGSADRWSLACWFRR